MNPHPQTPPASTSIHCAHTGDTYQNPGAHSYQWCPLCGQRAEGDQNHEIVITVTQ